MDSGIYRIRNKFTGKCYIGQTVDLPRRWQFHIIRLRVRTHKSKLLQRDFNNWMLQAVNNPTEFPFVFEVLLRCPVCSLEHTEMLFIAALQPEYNTQKFKTKRSTMHANLIKLIKDKYRHEK